MCNYVYKSMTYKDNAVYTIQCSRESYPNFCEKKYQPNFSFDYQMLGESNFEKWFIQNFLLTGSIKVTNNCNSVLKRLYNITKSLLEDTKYIKLNGYKNKYYKKHLNCETEEEKAKNWRLYLLVEEEIELYVSSFYDCYNLEYQNTAEKDKYI